MTNNMNRLREMIEKEKLDVNFVSFSVDPTVDSPSRLKEYGLKFTENLSKWDFLTGYSQEEIEKFAVENFKTLVKKPENDNQVVHGTSFFLVDKSGEIFSSFLIYRE